MRWCVRVNRDAPRTGRIWTRPRSRASILAVLPGRVHPRRQGESPMPRAAAVRPQKLYVFHPSPNLVSTVDALLADVAPGLAFENVIEPGLLDRAIRTGVTDEVRAEVANVLADIPAD